MSVLLGESRSVKHLPDGEVGTDGLRVQHTWGQVPTRE